jgi:hypothetical protein
MPHAASFAVIRALAGRPQLPRTQPDSYYGHKNTAWRCGQENYGVRIFSVKGAAFNILGTMHPLSSLVQHQGGMDRLTDLADIYGGTKIRTGSCITILLK